MSLSRLVDGGDASADDGAGGDVAVNGDGTVADRALPPTDSGREERIEGGSGGVATDASVGDATVDSTAASGTGTRSGLRVANWSPGAPAIDFCLAPHGTEAFTGPMMAGAAGDGGIGQLVFPQVSAYFPVQPVAYDVRIVIGAPGADCSLGNLLVKDTVVPNAGIPGSTGLVAGSNTTVALVGELQGASADSGLGLKLVTLSDDVVGPLPKMVTSPDASNAAPMDRFALRFVHAAPGLGEVSLGIGPADGIKPLLRAVGFGNTNQSKDGGGADPNGYLVQSAWDVQPVRVWLSATETDAGPGPALLPSPSITAAGRSVLTLVLTGTPTTGALQLLECVDDAATTDAYSHCRTITIETCGNGRRDPFEDCDCGPYLSISTSTDPQCARDPVNGNGVLPQICSTTCRLN